MTLEKIRLLGFRSIQDWLDFWIKPEVTTLVGANEHGKTNLLSSITYLNKDGFEAMDSCSAYKIKENEIIPTLAFSLRLSRTDKDELIDKVTELKNSIPSEGDLDEETQKLQSLYEGVLTDLKNDTNPELRLVLNNDEERKFFYTGKKVQWDLNRSHNLNASMEEFLDELIPQVKFFEASNELLDCITLEQLNQKHNLEFEGLIKLAGVWDEKEELFQNTTAAHKLRIRAERTLTRKIRQIWSQGKAHTFHFRVQDNQLYITIEDRTGTFDAPTNRSLGFRSFFSFYLSIYAQTATVSPKGYIFVFDEPGIHLHPQGQKDLLKEIRKIGKDNQIVYSTHSPFMIDRNDVTRTLLVQKEVDQGERGTKIVVKAYGANWALVRSSLGIVMNDSFFYTDNSLLVEGTSDRIYINSLLNKLKNKLDIDLNFLSIIDSDKRTEMSAMTRILLGEERILTVLVDSDEGGDELVGQLSDIAKAMKKSKFVNILRVGSSFAEKNNKSIENLLPRDVYILAVNKYIEAILKSSETISNEDLIKIEETNKTLGSATAELLKTKGLLKKESDFSKTTTADFFSQLFEKKNIDEVVDLEKQPYYKFCQTLKESLGLS